MKTTKTIRQTVFIPATPKEVYDTIIDSKKHTKFTGEKAKISKNIGGYFTCYTDYINGFNLDLIEGKKIVQAWRAKDWPSGVYSIVTFQLSNSGKRKTKLEFTQIGVPADDYQDKIKGWKTFYWEPLKAMFAV